MNFAIHFLVLSVLAQVSLNAAAPYGGGDRTEIKEIPEVTLTVPEGEHATHGSTQGNTSGTVETSGTTGSCGCASAGIQCACNGNGKSANCKCEGDCKCGTTGTSGSCGCANAGIQCACNGNGKSANCKCEGDCKCGTQQQAKCGCGPTCECNANGASANCGCGNCQCAAPKSVAEPVPESVAKPPPPVRSSPSQTDFLAAMWARLFERIGRQQKLPVA